MSIPLTLTALERTLDAAMLCCSFTWMNDMVLTMSILAYLSPRVPPAFSASTSKFSEFKLLGDGCCSQKMGASPTPCRHGSCPVVPFCRASRHRSSSWPEPSVKFLLESLLMELSYSTELLSAAPICKASEREPLLESPNAELPLLHSEPTGFCSAAPLCSASELKPLLESPGAELSWCLESFPYFPFWSHEWEGYYKVHQEESPCLIRLYYLLEVTWYPRGCH